MEKIIIINLKQILLLINEITFPYNYIWKLNINRYKI